MSKKQANVHNHTAPNQVYYDVTLLLRWGGAFWPLTLISHKPMESVLWALYCQDFFFFKTWEGKDMKVNWGSSGSADARKFFFS